MKRSCFSCSLKADKFCSQPGSRHDVVISGHFFLSGLGFACLTLVFYVPFLDLLWFWRGWIFLCFQHLLQGLLLGFRRRTRPLSPAFLNGTCCTVETVRCCSLWIHFSAESSCRIVGSQVSGLVHPSVCEMQKLSFGTGHGPFRFLWWERWSNPRFILWWTAFCRSVLRRSGNSILNRASAIPTKVSNLAFSVTEEEVRQICRKY